MISKQVQLQELMRTTIKRPAPGKSGDDVLLASREEIEERLRKTTILEGLGISTSNFDGDSEHEDSDVLNAILLVNAGNEIPDDLRQRLMEKYSQNIRNPAAPLASSLEE